MVRYYRTYPVALLHEDGSAVVLHAGGKQVHIDVRLRDDERWVGAATGHEYCCAMMAWLSMSIREGG
eukprot:2038065-Amphidinium_carterae.1